VVEKKLVRRFKLIIIVIAFVFSILVVRVIHLMFFQKELLASTPQMQNYRERGFILDRNGEKMALSLETYSVYARPHEIEQKKWSAKKLAEILDMKYQDILKLLGKNSPFIWIARQVDIKYIKALEELNLKGIYLEKEYKRYYPYGNLCSHVIGFSGIDNQGLEGIEYYFDDFLLPKRADNEGIDYFTYSRGYTVVLTIDRYIQEIVEEEIERAWERTGSRLVTGAVMNPSTGEILALANKPDYDLNNFSKYSDSIKRNKAITDSFEPGSTFKIFVAAALIDNGLISEKDTFYCNGWIDVGDLIIHDTGVHGRINFRQVLERSCNVGMVSAVKRIDTTQLYEKLRDFGFGTPTGINLPGEAKGILRNPGDWSGVSKYAIAIGQEVSATPLQLIAAASALANGGDLMQPRIIKQIEKPDSTIIKSYTPMKIRSVISKETSELLLSILKGVLTERGTGYKAYIDGYEIGGKTGTAQIADIENGGYLAGQFYSSFVGFIPVTKPRIVVLVTLDRPRGEVYGGGQTAAPVFKNIVERIAPYLNILPSFSDIYVLKDEL
jgi:cell division protein FtsI/penicillin-binding protein 2